MIINFMTREISRDMRKLARTPTLIKKKLARSAFVLDLIKTNLKKI
jgi:hypothetical protein